MAGNSSVVTYLYFALYVALSTTVIIFNKYILSTKYFGFPFPIALTVLHMAFSSTIAFLLVKVFKVVKPVNMSPGVYLSSVVPISACFAASLWLGNSAYLYISVAFIQMLKSLMPVATFLFAVVLRTDRHRTDIFLIMVWISAGVAIASYGEIHFHPLGATYQVAGICAEALRLVLTQALLQKKGLNLNPITSLYYIAPCSLLFLFVPWAFLEWPKMALGFRFDPSVFLANAMCALALNFAIFLVIGRTGAVTVRVVGVLKDWVIISISTLLFTDSELSGLTIGGYSLALAGVATYNFVKGRDMSKVVKQGAISNKKGSISSPRYSSPRAERSPLLPSFVTDDKKSEVQDSGGNFDKRLGQWRNRQE